MRRGRGVGVCVCVCKTNWLFGVPNVLGKSHSWQYCPYPYLNVIVMTHSPCFFRVFFGGWRSKCRQFLLLTVNSVLRGVEDFEVGRRKVSSWTEGPDGLRIVDLCRKLETNPVRAMKNFVDNYRCLIKSNKHSEYLH